MMDNNQHTKNKIQVLELEASRLHQCHQLHWKFDSSIQDALAEAEQELNEIHETIASVDQLKPECDKIDYAVAAGSGALCGILDVFLVGKPGESPLGKITDQWFANRTKDFAKLTARLTGSEFPRDGSLQEAIRFLEEKFKVPYDQRGAGDAGKIVFGLTPGNHHFKSLAHNPTLMGLFFSILDQFTNSSHFVSDGQVIGLVQAEDGWELQGGNIPAKLFSGFANWIGHLISDVSGSSSSKGRGMGIPSPLWTWTNDVIVIKKTLHMPVTQFDKTMNELTVKMFEKGYDVRFQTAQAIPVFINEMIVRLFYTLRRAIRYFRDTRPAEFSIPALWMACEPFSNFTVKRMLTVAHGTFCLVDAGDAVIRGFMAGGGNFNVVECLLRLNIVGVGRFTVSLYGEVKHTVQVGQMKEAAEFAARRQIIVENYIAGLNILADYYDDREILSLAADFRASGMYQEAFEQSILLAEKRGVPEEKILRTKADIDAYFTGGK